METLTELGYKVTFRTGHRAIVKHTLMGYNEDVLVDISLSRDDLYWIVDDNVYNNYKISYTRHVKLSAIIKQVEYRIQRPTTELNRFKKWVSSQSE